MNDCSKRVRKRAPVLLPLLLALIVLAICFIGMNSTGPINAKAKGDPADTARQFMDAIVEKDYAKADTLLYNCDGLRIVREAESDAQAAVFAALADSYAYSINGIGTKNSTTAALPVNFQYLNIAAMGEDINEVGQSLHGQDKEANFDEAVSTVLEHASDYYRNASFELKLVYDEDEWKVVADNTLLAALSGKAGGRS